LFLSQTRFQPDFGIENFSSRLLTNLFKYLLGPFFDPKITENPIIVLYIKIELFDESPVSPMMEKMPVLFDLATSE